MLLIMNNRWKHDESCFLLVHPGPVISIFSVIIVDWVHFQSNKSQYWLFSNNFFSNHGRMGTFSAILQGLCIVCILCFCGVKYMPFNFLLFYSVFVCTKKVTSYNIPDLFIVQSRSQTDHKIDLELINLKDKNTKHFFGEAGDAGKWK